MKVVTLFWYSDQFPLDSRPLDFVRKGIGLITKPTGDIPVGELREPCTSGKTQA